MRGSCLECGVVGVTVAIAVGVGTLGPNVGGDVDNELSLNNNVV